MLGDDNEGPLHKKSSRHRLNKTPTYKSNKKNMKNNHFQRYMNNKGKKIRHIRLLSREEFHHIVQYGLPNANLPRSEPPS